VKTGNGSKEHDKLWFDVFHSDGERAGEYMTGIEAAKDFEHSGASRSAFLDELVKLIRPEVKVRFGMKVTDVTAIEEGMKVMFENGEKAIVDAVIGCDEIKSVCRKVMLEG
jgi:salicylate hydroxylase